MRTWTGGVVLLGSLGLAACGGSSSESPWPIEPVDAEPGPFGEAPPAGDARDVKVPRRRPPPPSRRATEPAAASDATEPAAESDATEPEAPEPDPETDDDEP